VIDAAEVGAKVGACGAGCGAAGVLTVIGSSRLSSDLGAMLIPTTPTTPPMISAPNRMVNGSRTPSNLVTSNDFPVRRT
jgi:hypothetical protein